MRDPGQPWQGREPIQAIRATLVCRAADSWLPTYVSEIPEEDRGDQGQLFIRGRASMTKSSVMYSKPRNPRACM
jgi:hypothetical protein